MFVFRTDTFDHRNYAINFYQEKFQYNSLSDRIRCEPIRSQSMGKIHEFLVLYTENSLEKKNQRPFLIK